MRTSRVLAPLLSLAALLAVPPRLAHAAHPAAWADSTGAWPSAAAAHRPGRWSLDFAIGPNFTLSTFKGATLSATHTTSSTGAWRIGIGYNVSDDRSGGGGGLAFTDSTVTAIDGTERENAQVQLNAVVMRLHRFHPARRVAAYVAVGPDVSWARQRTELPRPLSPATTSIVNTYFHRVSAGIDAELGAEAVVTRDVGLFAQYGSTGGYDWSRQTVRAQVFGAGGVALGPPAEFVLRGHGWFLNPGGVRFGISLYL